MLTETEIIDTLEGRALDMAVAEQIIGWSPVPDAQEGYMRPPPGSWGHRHGMIYKVPRYSTDWKAMRDVVQKFRLGSYRPDKVACVIEMTVFDWDVNGCDCSCSIYSPTQAKVIAYGRDMPLAICRAALKAVQPGTK